MSVLNLNTIHGSILLFMMVCHQQRALRVYHKRPVDQNQVRTGLTIESSIRSKQVMGKSG